MGCDSGLSSRESLLGFPAILDRFAEGGLSGVEDGHAGLEGGFGGDDCLCGFGKNGGVLGIEFCE